MSQNTCVESLLLIIFISPRYIGRSELLSALMVSIILSQFRAQGNSLFDMMDVARVAPKEREL